MYFDSEEKFHVSICISKESKSQFVVPASFHCLYSVHVFNLKLLKLLKFLTKRQAVLHLSNFPGSRVNLCAMKGRQAKTHISLYSMFKLSLSDQLFCKILFLSNIFKLQQGAHICIFLFTVWKKKLNQFILKFQFFSAPDFNFISNLLISAYLN